MKTVYGPVPSWCLGKSLGIDPVCREEKICSMDCIYCQLGRTIHKTMERKKFVQSTKLKKELRKALERVEPEIVTFSGSSEPTLALNLGKMLKIVREESSLPAAILTNSSLLGVKEVRRILSEFGVLVAKLDAFSEQSFKKINKPPKELSFSGVLKGIKRMRREFKGERFALQCMFVEENKNNGREIASLAREIQPDEVQIDTPLRPSPVRALSKKELAVIEKEFTDLNFLSVYSEKKPRVKALNEKETHSRRPQVRE